MATMNDAVSDLAWHFLPDDGRLAYPPHTLVVVGETLRVDGPLIHCEDDPERRANGLHYSRRALDALGYARGSLACRVRVGSERVEKADKGCARERTVLWQGDATRLLHEYACWLAEDRWETLRARGHAIDPRSTAAIAVKRRWLDGQATDEELDAARVAAWTATNATAKAAVKAAARANACDAARATAMYAAREAARDAARAGGRDAAMYAANFAALERYNAELERRLIAAFAPAVEDAAGGESGAT